MKSIAEFAEKHPLVAFLIVDAVAASFYRILEMVLGRNKKTVPTPIAEQQSIDASLDKQTVN